MLRKSLVKMEKKLYAQALTSPYSQAEKAEKTMASWYPCIRWICSPLYDKSDNKWNYGRSLKDLDLTTSHQAANWMLPTTNCLSVEYYISQWTRSKIMCRPTKTSEWMKRVGNDALGNIHSIWAQRTSRTQCSPITVVYQTTPQTE
jgi:hypothetical protein